MKKLLITLLLTSGWMTFSCAEGLLSDFNCTASDSCDFWDEEAADGSCIVTVTLPEGGTYQKCIRYTGSLYQTNGTLVSSDCQSLEAEDEQIRTELSPSDCPASSRTGSCTFNADEATETVDIFYHSDDLEDSEAEALCTGDWEAASSAAAADGDE